MPDYSSQNFNQPTAYVPPPPTEVSIRTLDGDVRTMALSGGNFSQAEKVSVPHSVKYNAMGEQMNYQPKSSAIAVIIWVLAILLFLGALVYFLYPFLSGDDEGSAAIPSGATSTAGLPEVPDPDFTFQFSHRSFFVKGEKRVIDARVNYPEDVVANTEVYSREILQAIINQGGQNSTFFEVELNKTDGSHLSLNQFFDWAKFSLLPEKFWSENFGPDFNYFVFKENNTFRLGMVLRPKTGKSPILLKKNLLELEKSAGLRKFFLTDPGTERGAFSDSLLGGQTVRVKKFSINNAAFVYGWYNGNLVFTTSESAFGEAITRL